MRENLEIIFGYGSLMSLHGFFGVLRERKYLGNIKLLEFNSIHLPIGVRGFAKPTNSLVAMDVDKFELRGHFVQSAFKPNEGFVGVGLTIPREHFTLVCRREGYPDNLAEILIRKAERQKCSIGEYLFKIAKRVSSDGVLNTTNVGAYRRLLYREINGTSKHYIPHPLVIDEKIAIIFIAAGRYGTGKESLSGVKVDYGIHEVLNTYECYEYCRRRNLDVLKNYLVECFLSGIYGVSLHDLIEPLQKINDKKFKHRLKKSVEQRLYKERILFIHYVLNGDIKQFYNKFGDIKRNIKASGLPMLNIDLPKEVPGLLVKKAPSELDYLEYRSVPIAVLSDYYISLLSNNLIKIRHKDKVIDIHVHPISKFDAYAKRHPEYYTRVLLGEYILLNSVARSKLGVNVDETVEIILG